VKKLAALVLLATLTACKTYTPIPDEKLTVTKTVYLVKTPDAKLITLPPKPANVDLSTATQYDIAKWIVARDQYTTTLENQIIEIAKFLSDEATKAKEQSSK
jgi:hypothetical protein